MPQVLVTDKLGSYGVAHREMMPSVETSPFPVSEQPAEDSHQPTRQRERGMRRFKSPGHAQRFLSVFGVIGSHFRPGRHRLSASEYRQVMAERFAVWRERTDTTVAA